MPVIDPEPPDDIPAYIADGIARQDRGTLAAIEDYAHTRREYLETLAAQSVDEAELERRLDALLELEEVDSDDEEGIKQVIRNLDTNDRGPSRRPKTSRGPAANTRRRIPIS